MRLVWWLTTIALSVIDADLPHRSDVLRRLRALGIR